MLQARRRLELSCTAEFYALNQLSEDGDKAGLVFTSSLSSTGGTHVIVTLRHSKQRFRVRLLACGDPELAVFQASPAQAVLCNFMPASGRNHASPSALECMMLADKSCPSAHEPASLSLCDPAMQALLKVLTPRRPPSRTSELLMELDWSCFQGAGQDFDVLIVVLQTPIGLQLAVQPGLSFWVSAPMLLEVVTAMGPSLSSEMSLASDPTSQRYARVVSIPLGTTELLQRASVPMASALHPLTKSDGTPISNQSWK